MKLRTCEFCGTEYELDQPRCPVCGQSPDEQKRKKQKGGARAAGKNQGGQSRRGWAIACVILGIAVLAGIVYFFSLMDFFDPDFDFNAIPTHIEAGNEVQEDLTIQQKPQPEPQPEPEPEPEPEPDTDPRACTGLTISQSSVTMDEKDGKVFLTAVARPSDCKDPIVFTSSDESVATVTENGMITAVGPGEADITVTCGTVTQVCTVSCEFEAEPEEDPPAQEDPPTEEKPPEGESQPGDAAPELDKADFTLFTPGETTTLTVKNAPQGAAISYVSANPAVVTVDEKGTVTAVGEGDTTITVTVGSVKLTCAARCRMENASAGTGYTGPFKISHEDVTLSASGETFDLTLTDANGKTVSNVKWTASNGCVTISGSTIKAAINGRANVSCVYDGTTYSCIVRCVF